MIELRIQSLTEDAKSGWIDAQTDKGHFMWCPEPDGTILFNAITNAETGATYTVVESATGEGGQPESLMVEPL